LSEVKHVQESITNEGFSNITTRQQDERDLGERTPSLPFPLLVEADANPDLLQIAAESKSDESSSTPTLFLLPVCLLLFPFI